MDAFPSALRCSGKYEMERLQEVVEGRKRLSLP